MDVHTDYSYIIKFSFSIKKNNVFLCLLRKHFLRTFFVSFARAKIFSLRVLIIWHDSEIKSYLSHIHNNVELKKKNSVQFQKNSELIVKNLRKNELQWISHRNKCYKPVVGKIFGLSGHIHDLKMFHGPNKSENLSSFFYLLRKKGTTVFI